MRHYYRIVIYNKGINKFHPRKFIHLRKTGVDKKNDCKDKYTTDLNYYHCHYIMILRMG